VTLPSLAILLTPEDIIFLIRSIFAPSMYPAEDLREIIKALVVCVYEKSATANMYPPRSVIHYFRIYGTAIFTSEKITRWRDAYLVMLLAKDKGIAKDVWLKVII
jgi:hypothetical protein